jgi:hypothetical protein
MLTRTDIEKYFLAEKQESLLFAGIGVISIIVGLLCIFYFKTSYTKGIAIPAISIGILLTIVGYTVYSRADKQIGDNVYALTMNPEKLKTHELRRMKTVMKSFLIYRYTETVLLIIGIALYFYFKQTASNLTTGWGGSSFWCGFGIALSLLASLTLSADYFAERRGKTYLNKLEAFVEKK